MARRKAMTLPFKKTFILMIPMAFFLGCTKSEHPMAKILEKQFQAAQEKVAEIEAVIKKTPEQNQGLLLKLNQDKQLALSRLERLKEHIRAINPDRNFETQGGEGGGGHH
jgi:hypothetical protein